MAKPPEPLEEVLPLAVWVVDAEVVEVLKTGPKPPSPELPPKAKKGITSLGVKNAAQTVKLKVKRVLRGDAVKELVVEKPVGSYMLRAGNHGPFLVDRAKGILGRYGPDSYSFAKLEAAIGAQGPKRL
jgi:hypothetical protein